MLIIVGQKTCGGNNVTICFQRLSSTSYLWGYTPAVQQYLLIWWLINVLAANFQATVLNIRWRLCTTCLMITLSTIHVCRLCMFQCVWSFTVMLCRNDNIWQVHEMCVMKTSMVVFTIHNVLSLEFNYTASCKTAWQMHHMAWCLKILWQQFIICMLMIAHPRVTQTTPNHTVCLKS